MDNSHILGIDVGTSSIKVLIGRRTADGKVLIAGSGTIPTAGYAKGVILDAQTLAVSIRQAVDCAVMATNIPVTDAYIGIGGVEISSVNSTGSIAPAVTDAITHEDINCVYQASILTGVPDDQEVLHLLPQSFLVDKQQQVHLPLQQQCDHLEVAAHIVTMPKAVITSLITATEKLGINVVGMVANPIVATQILTTNGIENYLFMDVGAGTTELVLYRDGHVHLSASLPLGGDYITSDIMKGFGIAYNHAEEIKRYYAKLDTKLRGQNILLDCNDYGTTDKQFPYDFLYDIIESRIDEIVTLLHEYLKTSLINGNVDKIFLTGGCGAMPNVADSVEKLFGLPVEVVTLPSMYSEYASPTNVASYGVLTYAVNNVIRKEAIIGNTGWQSLLGKFKKFFNS